MTDTWTWATVTQASPLRIKVDGDTSELDATTDDLVGSLAVFDRVRVHLHADGIIVTGIQGGVVGTPEATAATANTLALRDGSGRAQVADPAVDDDIANMGWVEARSLTGKSESVNGVDMDTVKTSGLYQGYNMTNSASAGISTFLVMAYSPDWVIQIQIKPNSSPQTYTWMRAYHGGSTWSAWALLSL